MQPPDQISRLSNWYPTTKAIMGDRAPDTVIVETSLDFMPLMDGITVPGFDAFIADLDAAAESLGGYPVFLRSDHMSGKHEKTPTGLPPCFVHSKKDLIGSVLQIYEFTEMALWCSEGCDKWAVRKLLPSPAEVSGFFNLPIGPEWRFIVRDGVIAIDGCYWPKEAIRHPCWIDTRRELTPEEYITYYDRLLSPFAPGKYEELIALSCQIATALGGDWSVDWMQAADGEWYLIDMADADRSWIPGEHEPELSEAEINELISNIVTSS